jgi:hypothetical protein
LLDRYFLVMQLYRVPFWLLRVFVLGILGLLARGWDPERMVRSGLDCWRAGDSIHARQIRSPDVHSAFLAHKHSQTSHGLRVQLVHAALGHA